MNYSQLFILDEVDDDESMDVLDRLEKIDSETDNMDVTIVKMGDPRYARKWGVTKLPSVVYFRNRFPSIYRGIFFKEIQLLNTKNIQFNF